MGIVLKVVGFVEGR